jgi:redox-sensitive bicupin YhaK (pirin superfamily)
MMARSVRLVVPSMETREGAGFLVHRAFPTSSLGLFDPFLLLDEMGPSDLGPGEAKGAPDHPHRGFETVTYLLAGRMEHRDSHGNHGSLGPGDVQWMTAGRGVVHSEMPEADFASKGGRMHGFQLWVNLPARDKMMAPRYQEIPAARIPVARTEDGAVTIRVLAGEALGRRAAIDTRIPILYLDCQLAAGARLAQPIAPGENAFLYVVEGGGFFGADARPARQHEAVFFARDGDTALARAEKSPLRVLIFSGAPIGEPVARYGPFVMNTRAEILQAVEDYQSGKLADR